MIDSEQLLHRLGYDFIKLVSPRVSPPLVEEKFSDLLPALKQSEIPRCRRLAENRLYLHQRKSLEALMNGENLVLKAGTGSGKTEASRYIPHSLFQTTSLNV
ncbi:MAG: hypothetical protein QW463_05005 [Candidatus Caldarchaeum sp.]